MLTNYPGICRNLYLPDYTLFDLETTGVSCHNDDVVEISALQVRGGAVVNSFSSLVNPGRHIPGAASQVNHITDERVAGAPTMEEVLPESEREKLQEGFFVADEKELYSILENLSS